MPRRPIRHARAVALPLPQVPVTASWLVAGSALLAAVLAAMLAS